jgi:hypothetical protein
MSGASAESAAYDAIYATDLVYEADCFRLCGDAHCCHFDRYRRFGPPADRGVQKLPLLAGEHAYMAERGHLAQYDEPRLETTCIEGRAGRYRFDLLCVKAPGRCPCDHARRPTVCRLYPLQPLFEPGAGLVGVDPNFSFFEEIETLGGTPRACPLTALPFTQLALLLRICGAIAGSPRCLFSMMAQELSKRLFRERLLASMASQGTDVFTALGTLMRTGEFVEKEVLAAALDALLGRFRAVYGPGFAPAE